MQIRYYLRAGRRVHALWDAAGAVRPSGKWRFHTVHHPILHCDRVVQRERSNHRGDRRRSADIARTASQVQEHHHAQQHREVHRRVLDLRHRRWTFAFDLRENHRRYTAAQVSLQFPNVSRVSFNFNAYCI